MGRGECEVGDDSAGDFEEYSGVMMDRHRGTVSYCLIWLPFLIDGADVCLISTYLARLEDRITSV